MHLLKSMNVCFDLFMKDGFKLENSLRPKCMVLSNKQHMCKQDLKNCSFQNSVFVLLTDSIKHFGFFLSSIIKNCFKQSHAHSENQILKLEFFLLNTNSYAICFEQAVLQCWYNNAKFFFQSFTSNSFAIYMMAFEWTDLLTD